MNDTIRYETQAWQAIYRSDALRKRRFATHRKKIQKINLVDEPKTSRILDVCCGEGEMLDLLVQNGFTNLTGLDLPRKSAGEIRNKSWKYVEGSAAELPFENSSFDFILCAHSLHHLWPAENIKKFLAEAYRCLKSGAKLALIDHYNSPQLQIALSLLLSPLGRITKWSRLFQQQHLEEKEMLFDYLRHWTEVSARIKEFSFTTLSYQKDLFFFYWVLRK